MSVRKQLADQGVAVASEGFSLDGLGEDIGHVGVSVDLGNSNSSSLYLIADVVVADLDVLHTSVISPGVDRVADGRGAVAELREWSGARLLLLVREVTEVVGGAEHVVVQV